MNTEDLNELAKLRKEYDISKNTQIKNFDEYQKKLKFVIGQFFKEYTALLSLYPNDVLQESLDVDMMSDINTAIRHNNLNNEFIKKTWEIYYSTVK